MWNPNRVNDQYRLLLQNCYLQIVFPAATDKDGITPYLPIPIGRRLRPLGLSAMTERILQHPIYQFQLEGCYSPLVYQLQHPAGLLPTLAPPCHPDMFLTISLPLNSVTPTSLSFLSYNSNCRDIFLLTQADA